MDNETGRMQRNEGLYAYYLILCIPPFLLVYTVVLPLGLNNATIAHALGDPERIEEFVEHLSLIPTGEYGNVYQ